MSVNLFDLIVTLLILFLALKGLINGFIREIFAFGGLIGGVLISSRAAAPLADWTQSHILHLPNPAFTRLLLFILILSFIWGLLSWLGYWISQRLDNSFSLLSRIAGFALAGLKYFLIIAIIISVLYRTPAIRHKLQPFTKGSHLAVLLVKSGRILINLAPPHRRK